LERNAQNPGCDEKMSMNKKLQIKKLKVSAASRGLESEMIDFGAHFDSSLSYRENRRNFEKMFPTRGKVVVPKDAKKQRRKKSDDDLYQIGKSNRELDKKRSAKLPGKRRVYHKSGKRTTYYERRKNRSDRPGPWRL
jgi:hypothetical protein